MNCPVAGVGTVILALLVLGVVFAARTTIVKHLRAGWRLIASGNLGERTTVLAGLGMAGFAVLVAVAQELALLIGLVALVAAVAWEYRHRLHLEPRAAR